MNTKQQNRAKDEPGWNPAWNARIHAALDQCGQPSESVMEAVRVAAAAHAVRRRSSWRQWWSLWKPAVALAGSIAAAFLLLVMSPGGKTLHRRADSAPAALSSSAMREGTLALLLASDAWEEADIKERPTLEWLADCLLRLQETGTGLADVQTLLKE